MNRQKPRTRKEIAQDLGICTRTLKRRLLKQGLKIPNGLISPKLQNIIKSKFELEEEAGLVR